MQEKFRLPNGRARNRRADGRQNFIKCTVEKRDFKTATKRRGA